MRFLLFIVGFAFTGCISILYLINKDHEPHGAIVSLVLWMALGIIVASFSYLAFSSRYQVKGKSVCLSVGALAGISFYLGLSLATFDIGLGSSLLVGLLGIVGITRLNFKKNTLPM